MKFLHLVTNNDNRSVITQNKSYSSNVTLKTMFYEYGKNTIYCPDYWRIVVLIHRKVMSTRPKQLITTC